MRRRAVSGYRKFAAGESAAAAAAAATVRTCIIVFIGNARAIFPLFLRSGLKNSHFSDTRMFIPGSYDATGRSDIFSLLYEPLETVEYNTLVVSKSHFIPK